MSNPATPLRNSASAWTVDWFQPMRTLTNKYIIPPCKALASKVDAAWHASLPYLTKAMNFVASKGGIGFGLLVAAVVISLSATQVNNKLVSTALIVAGLLIAVAAGYFICASGVGAAALAAVGISIL